MKIAAVTRTLAAAVFLGAQVHASLPAVRQDARAAQLEEYTRLFVSLAAQALAHPRLASPMPCLPHWLAGNDHLVVAVSDRAAAAGLEPGDVLQRVGETTLTGRADGVWDVAMRALNSGALTYAVAVTRDDTTVRLTLPCAADLARALNRAERGMWTAVSQRDWTRCIAHGEEMISAFGSEFSPPLMIMNRCAAATGDGANAALTSRLGHALLSELVAYPEPPVDLREQLRLTLKDLDAIQPGGGEDYAGKLRERIAILGLEPL